MKKRTLYKIIFKTLIQPGGMARLFSVSVSFLLAILILNSCFSVEKSDAQEFEIGKVYPKICCAADSSQSYALFLPSNYDKNTPCPVLVLFDSHGDGLLPVNLFSNDASKSGFIVAGSNNSKNGMTLEETTAIYRNVLADLTSRFTIEKKAIYLGGFSGGSRVAAAAAITEGGVAGVVGCGAGLPNLNQKPQTPFSYLAVVGNQDFNLTEMMQLDESLEKAGYQHHLLLFDGIHQWPPKELIPDIFTWLRFDAMRQKSIPENRSDINLFIEQNDKKANDLASKIKFPEQQEIYQKMVHYLNGLTDVSPLLNEIERLENETSVVAFHQQKKDLKEMEQALQQKYLPEIEQKDVNWWKKETAKLFSLAENPKNPETGAVYKRLLGSLSLSCYMYSNAALKQGNLALASKHIEIYSLVDPSNAEHRYMAAKVAALNGNSDEVFTALNQALELGFLDYSRLDSDFSAYRNDKRFKCLQLVR
jgi:pimeloyl-ACP methyl ester carboxylesterase